MLCCEFSCRLTNWYYYCCTNNTVLLSIVNCYDVMNIISAININSTPLKNYFLKIGSRVRTCYDDWITVS